MSFTPSQRFVPSRIIGHRGARAEAPENTLGGFAHLQSLNIHKVELDVHLSKDKQLIVIHDTTLDRTTNATGLISALNQAEFATINAAAKFDQPWPHEPVPTLKAVTQNWAALEHIQIEVKPLPNPQPRHDAAQALHRFLARSHLNGLISVITSSDPDFLQESMHVNNVPHGLVADSDKPKPLELCLSLGAQLLVLHYLLYTDELAKRCAAKQMPVSLWTVNNPTLAHELIDRGADSIITDCPSAMLASLLSATDHKIDS